MCDCVCAFSVIKPLLYFDIWCCTVECSFECITKESGAVHSGAIEVAVNNKYSATSEEHFTFKVVLFIYPELSTS